MKNIEVVEAFERGIRDATSHTGNLYIDENKLVNYNTTIAQWDNDRMIINKTKYSVSTSKIQGMIYGHNAIEVKGVPMNAFDLKKYILETEVA